MPEILVSCHLEWKHIWPKLAEYHLLIPDLPCHSKSRNTCQKQDYSVGLCADLVAEMVRGHAHDGRAHVVGMGTSGFIVLDIVRRHPEVVASGFVSGAWPQKGARLAIAKHPRLLYAGLWSILHSRMCHFASIRVFYAFSLDYAPTHHFVLRRTMLTRCSGLSLFQTIRI